MNLKLVRPLLPYLSAYIIILGLLKSIFYYKYFEIKITEFIGFDEIIILFVEDFFLVILSLICLSLGMIMLSDLGKNLNINKNIFSRKKSKSEVIFEWIAYVAIAIAVVIIITTESYFTRVLYSLSVILFGSRIIIITIYKQYYASRKTLLDPTYNNIAVWLILSTTMVVFVSIKRAKEVENGKYKGTVIQTKDSIYISTATSFYIGKTKDYFFVYNKKDTTSTIVPASEVQGLLLKTNF